MLRAPTALSFAIATLALAGCKDKDATPSTDPLELIPADIQGVYGRDVQDSPGMVVSATGLEFGEMKLTIHEGKMEGDTVRVERATLKWEKLDAETCTGTIARQKDKLLMSLYEVGGEQGKCELLLDVDWFRWEPITELPEQLRGRFDVVTIGANELKIELGWFSAKMVTDKIYRLPGSNDERVELLVENGKVISVDAGGKQVETPCTGTIKLEDGWMKTEFWVPKRFELPPDASDLDKAAYNEHVRTCEDWRGRAQKFEVSLDNLPKAPIEKRDVKLSIAADKVVLESPALRCEQELWRTESISARYGVFGGERMTLGKAEPTGVSDACRTNMRIWCERYEGNDASALDTSVPASETVADCMKERERELCPESITVQAISDVRYKFMVEPRVFNELACVDTTGDFTLHK